MTGCIPITYRSAEGCKVIVLPVVVVALSGLSLCVEWRLTLTGSTPRGLSDLVVVGRRFLVRLSTSLSG